MKVVANLPVEPESDLDRREASPRFRDNPVDFGS